MVSGCLKKELAFGLEATGAKSEINQHCKGDCKMRSYRMCRFQEQPNRKIKGNTGTGFKTQPTVFKKKAKQQFCL